MLGMDGSLRCLRTSLPAAAQQRQVCAPSRVLAQEGAAGASQRDAQSKVFHFTLSERITPVQNRSSST